MTVPCSISFICTLFNCSVYMLRFYGNKLQISVFCNTTAENTDVVWLPVRCIVRKCCLQV